ncbi:MAG TPA: phosphatase PAP2 family protein, partial [Byssovorax sp.]
MSTVSRRTSGPPDGPPPYAAAEADGEALAEPTGERSSTRPVARGGVVAALPRVFCGHDLLLLGYLVVLSCLVATAPAGPDRSSCARQILSCLAIVLVGCLARGTPALPPLVRSVVYRVALAGVLLWDYLMLREVLPLLRPDSVDDTLRAIDVRLFGFEPALWLERFNQRPIVEWFSFFYFSYFFMAGTYLLAVVWISKLGRATQEFAMGTLIVFSIGELGYVAVPAYGPIRHLASIYHAPVNGGFFWGCVSATVEAGSAMKDVFPSLHTAVPTWFTLYALRRARFDKRWVWPARVTGFFAANIVVSTLLLRWHYAIDVIAGLALACVAGFGG